jgi:hypothetical protein
MIITGSPTEILPNQPRKHLHCRRSSSIALRTRCPPLLMLLEPRTLPLDVDPVLRPSYVYTTITILVYTIPFAVAWKLAPPNQLPNHLRPNLCMLQCDAVSCVWVPFFIPFIVVPPVGSFRLPPGNGYGTSSNPCCCAGTAITGRG